MAGTFRKEWLAFKKAYPDFEKSKKFKGDFGPMLDNIEKTLDEAKAAQADYEKGHESAISSAHSVSKVAAGAVSFLEHRSAPKDVLEHFTKFASKIEKRTDGRSFSGHEKDIAADWTSLTAGIKKMGFDTDSLLVNLKKSAEAEQQAQKKAALEDTLRKSAAQQRDAIKETGKAYLKTMLAMNDKLMLRDFESFTVKLTNYYKANHLM